jgi:hypothetical protein
MYGKKLTVLSFLGSFVFPHKPKCKIVKRQLQWVNVVCPRQQNATRREELAEREENTMT